MMHAVDDDHGNHGHDHGEAESSSATPDRPRRLPAHNNDDNNSTSSPPPAAPAPTPTRRSTQRRSMTLPSPPSSAERRRVRRTAHGEERASPPPTDAHRHRRSSSGAGAAARRNAPPPPSSSSNGNSGANGGIMSAATTPQRRRGAENDSTPQRRRRGGGGGGGNARMGMRLHSRRSPSPRKSSPTPPKVHVQTTPHRGTGHGRAHSSPGNSGGIGGGGGVINGAQIQRTTKRRINLARMCLGLAATLWVYAAASNYGMMRRMHDGGAETGGHDDDGIAGNVPRFRDVGSAKDANGGGESVHTGDAAGGEGGAVDGGGGVEGGASAEVEPGTIPVFVPLSDSDPKSPTVVAGARSMIESSPLGGQEGKGKEGRGGIVIHAQGPAARREFLRRHGARCHPPAPDSTANGAAVGAGVGGGRNPILERYDALPGGDDGGQEWRLQLWKYCALGLRGAAVFHDPSVSTLLRPLGSILGDGDGVAAPDVGVAVRNRARGLIHDSSLLVLGGDGGGEVARGMLDRIMDLTSPHGEGDGRGDGDGDGDADGLALSRTLHDLVTTQMQKGGGWTLLEQRCAAPVGAGADRVLAEEGYGTCDPAAADAYCCHVLGPPVVGGEGGGGVAMLTRHFAAFERPRPPRGASSTTTTSDWAGAASGVTRLVPLDSAKPPTAAVAVLDADLLAPNFHDVMSDADCLPQSNRHCLACLESGGTCFPDGGVVVEGDDCTVVCGCYCAALCSVRPRPKPTTREYAVVPPGVGVGVGVGGGGGGDDGGVGSSGRYIPRRIHQIWHETISRKKYPQLSRITQSFRTQSGWKYDLHTHSSVAIFLRDHFPPEVREAYDSLLPKRFRTDLARYCLLFVYGGVYADADVMLQANLDNAIDADVGFVGVLDQTFEEGKRPMCLSNSFLASSPGHPFLARAIELIVNNARNRFTAVDYDDMMCPSPKTNLTYKYSNQFTTGPCLLGAAVNDVLGRHMQTPFGPGDVVTEHGGYDNSGPRGSRGRRDGGEDASARRRLDAVPGRSVLLRPRLKDMGDLRFTLVDRSILVGTVMRRNLLEKRARPDDLLYKSVPQGRELSNGVVYGTEGVYRDDVAAHEEVRFIFS